MKKLILFTSSFPYGKGEQFLEDEIEFLSKNFKVKIIPFSYGRNPIPRKLPDNIEIMPPISTKIFSILNFTKILKNSIHELKKIGINFKRFRLYLSAVRCASLFLSNRDIIKELLNLSKNDLIYFYWGHVSAFSIPFLPTLKAKMVMRLHGGDLYEYLHGNYFPFREIQLRKVNAVVPISHDGANYLLNKYPFVKNKVFVYKLGVKNDNFITPPSKDKIFRIVSISSITPVKRVDLICDILKYIKSYKILWTHFGDGPLRKNLEKKIKNLPSNIKVSLKGFVSRKEIFQFFRKNPVDLFINVSLNEGIPVSIMEAISFGIPVLATAVGGTPEIVNSQVGILINKNFSAKEVANIILKILLQSPFDRKYIKSYWRKYYNAEKNYTEFVNFIKDL